MDEFSYPGIPKLSKSLMVPGKRPLSSLAPSIVVDKNGDVKVVIGAAGGFKIITAIAQVLIRILWFNQNLKEAVDAPRFHHQLNPIVVEYNYGLLQQIVNGLERLGHTAIRYETVGSIVCALVKDLNKIYGNADYQGVGGVSGID